MSINTLDQATFVAAFNPFREAFKAFTAYYRTPGIEGLQSGFGAIPDVLRYGNFTAGIDQGVEPAVRTVRFMGEVVLGAVPVGFAVTANDTDSDLAWPDYTVEDFDAWLVRFYEGFRDTYQSFVDQVKSRQLDARAGLLKQQYQAEVENDYTYRVPVVLEGNRTCDIETRAIVTFITTQGQTQWDVQEHHHMVVDGRPVNDLPCPPDATHPLFTDLGQMFRPGVKRSESGLILP